MDRSPTPPAPVDDLPAVGSTAVAAEAVAPFRRAHERLTDRVLRGVDVSHEWRARLLAVVIVSGQCDEPIAVALAGGLRWLTPLVATELDELGALVAGCGRLASLLGGPDGATLILDMCAASGRQEACERLARHGRALLGGADRVAFAEAWAGAVESRFRQQDVGGSIS